MRRIGSVCLLFSLAVLAGGGCANVSTSKSHLVGMDDTLARHDLAGAMKRIQKAKTTAYKEKDRILYYLDAGLLCHYNGRWEESNELLTQADQSIEEAYTRSVSRAAASVMLNDNALEYAGEDYENIYLHVFKGVNYLRLGSFDSAFVEVRRINDKLNVLEDKYARIASEYKKSDNTSGSTRTFKPGSTRFHNSALARYLSMLMYRAEGRPDDARIDLAKIQEAWQAAPSVYDFPMPPLSTALASSPTAYAKLNVVAFYGRSPDKLAKTLYIHTQPTAITIMTTEQVSAGNTKVNTLDVIPWNIGTALPAGSSFKFEIPYMKRRDTRVNRAILYLNGYPVGDLVPIERLDQVALETFKIREPLIFLKTITRVIAKTIIKVKAVEELKKKNDDTGGAELLLDITMALTENADLRIGQFFPSTAAIREIEVPSGNYRATILYTDKRGTRLHQDELGMIDVRSGQLNLLPSYYLN
ncbi:MAG TPA: hypothetical protein DCS43_06970 [Verrucomicrobia bacterium]|nr:hypothetical protein [Verrucomicrobiota bacterium]